MADDDATRELPPEVRAVAMRYERVIAEAMSGAWTDLIEVHRRGDTSDAADALSVLAGLAASAGARYLVCHRMVFEQSGLTFSPASVLAHLLTRIDQAAEAFEEQRRAGSALQ